MRVIAGKARRINLISPSGMDVRPTQDRIKETLFNILQDDIPGCRFLDLFAGTGGIGIEALSRGAAHASFVERDKKALACIRENLAKTRLADDAAVYSMDVMAALGGYMSDSGVYDIIFADPPYHEEYEERLIRALSLSTAVGPETIIIIEAALETELDFIDDTCFEIYRVKDYKSNRHIFIRKKLNTEGIYERVKD